MPARCGPAVGVPRSMSVNHFAHKNHIAANEMNSDVLQTIIGKQSFTLQDIDFPGVDDMLSLINIFIEFEKDGILFYEMLRSFIKDQDVLESLDQIIAEEYHHIETLQEIKLQK